MNKEQLKELVKAHFNLVDAPEIPTEIVEESFGEMEDENKAFKIVYEGDLKVGTEVYVETAEGQKTYAPDGYHKLADGTVIKTEGGKVVEVATKEAEVKEEEEMTKTEMSAEDPGTEPEEVKEEVVEAEIEASTAEIVEELANAFKAEIAKVSNELAELKEKFSKISDEPASERTLPIVNKEESKLVDNAPNADRIKMALEMIKKKK